MTSDPAGTPVRWERFLQEWGIDRDHIEPGEFESDAFWFARDAVAQAQRPFAVLDLVDVVGMADTRLGPGS